jgi:hypothetical protein
MRLKRLIDEPDTTENIILDLIVDFRALAFDYGGAYHHLSCAVGLINISLTFT